MRIASTLGNDVEKIRRVRSHFARGVAGFPLCGAKGFAALESVYCELWQRWCDEQAKGLNVDESDAESEGEHALLAEDSRRVELIQRRYCGALAAPTLRASSRPNS